MDAIKYDSKKSRSRSGRLKAGDKVTFPGFGTFEVAQRAGRKGRNPQAGAELNIAASKSGKFSAGKNLKNLPE